MKIRSPSEMYLTSLELQNEIVKIAKEIFGGK